MNPKNSVLVETVAGITTFITMAYIIFLHPAILSNTGMDKNALIVVTCLISAISTMAVGLIAKVPIAMAPGLGLNTFFAYSLVKGENIPWETALGTVFISGFVFMILTFLGLRKKIVESIPQSMIYSITVGIGVFIAFIGLQNMGLIKSHPVNLVEMGNFTPTVLISLGGLLFILVLEAYAVKGSLLLGILFSTALSIILGYIEKPVQFISSEIDISPVFLKLNIKGAFKWGFAGAIFSLMFVDMFDSIGTLVGCLTKLGKVDKYGRIKGLNRLLGIDALATMVGALLGTSTTTSFIESAAGIESGGKRGLSSVITGSLFLLGILFVPLINLVPSYATAPALLIVGLYMMREVTNINFNDFEEGFPAFVTILMIALSFSISSGLAIGFISYVLLKVFRLKFNDLNITLIIIALLSVLFLIL